LNWVIENNEFYLKL